MTSGTTPLRSIATVSIGSIGSPMTSSTRYTLQITVHGVATPASSRPATRRRPVIARVTTTTSGTPTSQTAPNRIDAVAPCWSSPRATASTAPMLAPIANTTRPSAAEVERAESVQGEADQPGGDDHDDRNAQERDREQRAMRSDGLTRSPYGARRRPAHRTSAPSRDDPRTGAAAGDERAARPWAWLALVYHRPDVPSGRAMTEVPGARQYPAGTFGLQVKTVSEVSRAIRERVRARRRPARPVGRGRDRAGHGVDRRTRVLHAQGRRRPSCSACGSATSGSVPRSSRRPGCRSSCMAGWTCSSPRAPSSCTSSRCSRRGSATSPSGSSS